MSPCAHSASALHARLQTGTRKARQSSIRPVATARLRRPRVTEGDVWKLLDNLRVSAAVESTLSVTALSDACCGVARGHRSRRSAVQFPSSAGPILIVRSGPWPLLRVASRRAVQTIARLTGDVCCVIAATRRCSSSCRARPTSSCVRSSTRGSSRSVPVPCSAC